MAFREDPSDDVLVDIDAEGKGELLRDAPAAESWIAQFHLQNGCHEF